MTHKNDPYRIQIGDADLNFQPETLDDPVLKGLQILDLAKAGPPEEYMVYQLLPDGELKELPPTETIDLRSQGVERFIVFKKSAPYRFELDGHMHEWEAPVISGIVLKKLAGVDSNTYNVWREVPGSDDDLIDNDKLVQLDEKGLERFFTGKAQSTEG